MLRVAASISLVLVTAALAGCGVGREDAGEPAASGARLLLLGRFQVPTYVTSPPGDRSRRFVVERAGRIRVVRGGRTLDAPFLDIRRRVSTVGESGMLSLAFAPDYARSRRFYVYFVDREGAIRVEQFERAQNSADRALPGSAKLVIRQPHPRDNHKGGQVAFGPDGMLYTAFGDGGGSGDPDRNAQRRDRLLGKLLRIDPRPGGGYSIPRGNPGVGRPEIYAYGLRNPYRFSFDRRGGRMLLADVGQDAVEEVDLLPGRGRGRAPKGGQNFGWSLFEGKRRFRAGSAPRHVPPVIQRTHDQGWCSVIGGYVVRDRSVRSLYGRYVFGDLCQSRLWIARVGRRGSRVRPTALRVRNLSSFGEDAQGRVYAVSLSGGVYRLAAKR